MHTLESFALSCGLKISKPYIYQKYYPTDIDNYIIIDSHDNKCQAKNYDYWQEVVNLISEQLLEKNIKVLQFCNQNDYKIINAYSIIGLNFNQKAYIINNSLLYIGYPGLNLQMASHLNKKIVGLYSTIYPSQGNPYWSDKKDVSLIQAFNENDKPSYFPVENPKTVNDIKPDKIAQEILNKLNIKSNLKYKYTWIGSNFNQKTIEIVPNSVVNPASLNLDNMIVRMDIEFNEQTLERQLQLGKCIIVTNRSISEEILSKYRKNIIQVFYKIEDDNDPAFPTYLKLQNINFIMASYLSEEKINKLKMDYMDLGLITRLSFKTKSDIPESKYYKSNRYILSNNKIYISEAALKDKKPIKDFNENIQQVIDDEIFWRHADSYAFLID